MHRPYTWTIAMQINKTWIEDGFVVDDDWVNDMLMRELNCATEHEVSGEVLEALNASGRAVICIRIDPCWVADGFNPDNKWVCAMLLRELDCATEHEVSGRILRAPKEERIAKEMGYQHVAQMRAAS